MKAAAAVLAVLIPATAYAGAGIGMGSHYGDPAYGVSSSYGSYNSGHTSFTGPIPQIYQLPSRPIDLSTLSPSYLRSLGLNPNTRRFLTSPSYGNPGRAFSASNPNNCGCQNSGHH